MVNKILLFCFIALAHWIFCSVLSLFHDPLIKRKKKKLVLAFIAQFSRLQSDTNCPDESVLKQSKQNWARLWSAIKRPLSICISEHAPVQGDCPPPHSPCPPICLQRHHSTSEGKEDQCPASASLSQALYSNLYHIYSMIYNTAGFSAGL